MKTTTTTTTAKQQRTFPVAALFFSQSVVGLSSRSNVNSAVIETQRAATAVTRPGSLRNASVRSKVTQQAASEEGKRVAEEGRKEKQMKRDR